MRSHGTHSHEIQASCRTALVDYTIYSSLTRVVDWRTQHLVICVQASRVINGPQHVILRLHEIPLLTCHGSEDDVG